MAVPTNRADCNCNPSTAVPTDKYANDGTVTNVNVQNGTYVAPNYCRGTFDLSTSDCAEVDSNYQASLMAESLSIAAGPVNVFPLLGVQNQGSTLDQPGDGFPISSGTPSGYNALNAFNVTSIGWQSIQTGSGVTSAPAFIGYDFGTKKAWELIGAPQERYFPTMPVRHQISTLKIKQSSNSARRATQLRVECSDDGIEWKRVSVLTVPNTDQLVTLGINSNAGYNKWRIIPTFFTGVATN